ncbi:BAR adaptor protein Hob3 [Friedmanniomyces endolithicus]|nr:BAR adaptor protein Hob3 [Friedmanniomyces endolithicus]
MSWSGFKKAASRAGTQVMMKTGQVEKTSDREYEVEERRFRTLESASLRLQKEAKGYLDSLRAMTASQMRIAETIDAFYGEAGAKDGVSRSYKQAVEDLDAETVKALDGPYRCVPVQLYQCAFDEDKGVLNQATINEIEAEMNEKGRLNRGESSGNTTGVASVSVDLDGAIKLMDYVYRTTVLEPISRFCAYFPDINECIKKRNHKLLDYDSVRARVRKLTEKPDKDPSKLPRTEKEAEMVSINAFLRESHEDTSFLDVDLSVPSPPKTQDTIRRVQQQLQQDEEEFLRRHSGLRGMRKSPSMMSRVSSFGRATQMSCEDGYGVVRSPSSGSHLAGLHSQLPVVRESSTETLPHPLSAASDETGGLRTDVNMDRTHPTLQGKPTSTAHLISSPSTVASILSATRQKRIDKRHDGSNGSGNACHEPPSRTPFFHPSELEQIMQPLKQEYIRNQTDEVLQAKAAYDQLNEQLTSELPQLIDLRVPYLDPSFEALVKIQLRFCAEAYSRMAQVQQYMDASTRDQYASGELDARVEEALGQIRELSIAGTV